MSEATLEHETPPAAPAAADSTALSRSEWLRSTRRARLLSWASLGYMTVEGAIGVIAGVAAGSIALVGSSDGAR